MKITEIREMTIAELTQKVAEAKKTLNKMKVDSAVTQIEKTSTFRTMRRDIARMLTIINEKKQQENNN